MPAATSASPENSDAGKNTMNTVDLPPLEGDVVDLARALVAVPSVSGDETVLADAVERALRRHGHLSVRRDGDCVVARTELGRTSRVVLAGHLDTVPLTEPEPNLPPRFEAEDGATLQGAQAGADGSYLWGRGSVDMKGGDAVLLHLAGALAAPAHDVTFVFYDHEEVSENLNGLGRAARNHPEWFGDADLAILAEPTGARVEGGCNGTLRVAATTRGTVAHSARPWRGVNAIHAAAPVLQRLASYEARTADVDGLSYREGLSAVGIRGGVATNSIPDLCTVDVNFRFAPDRSGEQALAHVREVFADLDVDITLEDLAEGARPGLDAPAARSFAHLVEDTTGHAPVAKLGWTDVARFSALGVPALNFGPGDPMLCHTDDERCAVADIRAAARLLRAWLVGAAPGSPELT